MVERVSVEVTNRCSKACAFCYSVSGPRGETTWTAVDLVGFVQDLARGGVRAVSFGGGEPLEWPALTEVLAATRGLLFRSVTTNGLLLDRALDALVASGVDKVHVSIHFPDRPAEIERAVRQCAALAERGVASGVNLLVARNALPSAATAVETLGRAGIGLDRLVLLPQRITDTPTPAEVARVAGAARFQSMTCLAGCAKSPRFAAISWDRRVGWCSYTTARAALTAPTHAALLTALDGLGLSFCGAPSALPVVA